MSCSFDWLNAELTKTSKYVCNLVHLLSFILASSVVATEPTDTSTFIAGKEIFSAQCDVCHNGNQPEAPLVGALKIYPPERIVEALESGVMSTQGIPLSKTQKVAVAYFLTGKVPQNQLVNTINQEHYCKAPSAPEAKVLWNGWGGDLLNQRYQAGETQLSPENISNLTLKWAFAFPGATRVRSQPVVTEKSLFIGSQEGNVYALDRLTGCIRWQFQAQAEVRGGIHIGMDDNGVATSLYFGDFKANAYALDARTGTLNWMVNVHDHPMASVTGSVSATRETVFVPVSSLEVISAANDDYSCCSFRGTLVALDAETGREKWRSFTTDKPKPTKPNAKGVMQLGPSGAPIWSRPALDIKRQLVYVTTGQNYSSPATVTSDALLAFDMRDGAFKWSSQAWENDAWNGACVRKRMNCPDEDGPDFDVGTGALLATTKKGKDIVVIGQKSGLVLAFDPDKKGKMLWKRRLGSGGTMGGVHWGLSSNGDKVFVGISDLPTRNPYSVGEPQPGVASVDIETGEIAWQQVLPNVCDKQLEFRCFPGVSAAVTSSPGLVYAGGLDGVFRIYSAAEGKVLWQDSTHRAFDTINGVKGIGGAIEADGPVIADGHVFLTSGYDKWGEIPGNVLLVYALEGE